jgi:hypothetical protein
VTISEVDESISPRHLVPKVTFDVLLNEWGDVFFGRACFNLPSSPSSRDFRIPFTLYARMSRHALAQRDEGDAQYEVRGGRIYDYDGNMLTDPPRPRRPRSPDPRRDVDLKEVARIYNSADRAPTETVARQLHLAQRTAERRVADAKAEGLIDRPRPRRPRDRTVVDLEDARHR